MIISIIVAMGRDRAIGINNQLPWYLPEDLKNFRRLTMGHHILFGRKTFESLNTPLFGRKIMVLSKNVNYRILPEVGVTKTSLPEAIDLAQSRGESELFIGGGEGIYREALTVAQKIYLTRVDYSGPADRFFPQFEDGPTWKQSKEEFTQQKGVLTTDKKLANNNYQFQIWQRARS